MSIGTGSVYMSSFPFAIASGQSLSAAVDLGGQGITRLIMDPTAWTAAVVTMQVSNDGATYNNLYNADGTEWSITVAAQNAIVMDLTVFSAMRFVKLRSGTNGTPVNQGAARVLTLITRPY